MVLNKGNETQHVNIVNASGNKAFLLERKLIQNEQVIVEYMDALIYNCSFENTTLLVMGDNSTAVLIEESTFHGSEVIVNSTRSCSIEYCNFVTDRLVQEQESRYMLNVYGVNFLNISQNLFGSVTNINNSTKHEEREDTSHRGIKLENVVFAEIRNCSFRNIVSKDRNGSALHIIDSTVSIISCDFHGNIARFGNIFGGNFANITCVDSVFTSNRVSNYGGVFYLENHSILFNMDSVFKNNSAELNGGVIYGANNILNENDNCLFQYNLAKTGHGGVIRVVENSDVVNIKVNNQSQSLTQKHFQLFFI